MKKVLSLVLSAAMALSMSAVAFAAENESYLTAEGVSTAASNITLKVTEYEEILIATVPIELPIVVSSDGIVTCSTDAKIVNNTSDKTIQVTNVKCTFEDGYKRTGYNSSFTSATLKQVAISMFGEDVTYGVTTDVASTKTKISPKGELPLDMMAKVSPAILENSLETTSIGTVTFTIAIID